MNKEIYYGNYINAPLFGALVPKGKTVFVYPNNALKPYPKQWKLLQNIQTVPELVRGIKVKVDKDNPMIVRIALLDGSPYGGR